MHGIRGKHHFYLIVFDDQLLVVLKEFLTVSLNKDQLPNKNRLPIKVNKLQYYILTLYRSFAVEYACIAGAAQSQSTMGASPSKS